MEINKIIIWGHLLHSHTHSYIHNGYYVAFKEMGYDTHWFDDNSDISNFDFSNSLFITEQQVDNKIPKRKDCLYFVHFLEKHKYPGVNISNLIDLRCTFRDMNRACGREYQKDRKNPGNLIFTPLNKKKFEYYSIINNQLTYYTMWAADLLPKQIEYNINNISDIQKKKTHNIYFVGSLMNIWCKFKQICNVNKIPFFDCGAKWIRGPIGHQLSKSDALSIEMNEDLIQKSYIAPALQSKEQVYEEYIPCRIFKNISYGKMGITNNKKVYELFDKKIIYDPNIVNLINKSILFEKNPDTKVITELMKYVKNNHTYVQRIESLKIFINKHTSFTIM